MYTRRKDEAKKKPILIINNRFVGKESSHIRFAPKTLILATIILPILIIVLRDFELALELSTFEIVCLILLVRNRVLITKQGLYCHGKHFLWKEIKTIGVAVTKRKAPHKFYRKLIYISKHHHDKPLHLLDRRQYTEVEEIEGVEIIDYRFGRPEYLITASFNRRLLRHIMAYWGDDIKSLEDTFGWDCYAKLYNSIHRNS